MAEISYILTCYDISILINCFDDVDGHHNMSLFPKQRGYEEDHNDDAAKTRVCTAHTSATFRIAAVGEPGIKEFRITRNLNIYLQSMTYFITNRHAQDGEVSRADGLNPSIISICGTAYHQPFPFC